MPGKKRARKPLEFRNTQLIDALQTQDMAAVAFALRHGPTVVPLMRPAPRDNPLDTGEVWTYRDPRDRRRRAPADERRRAQAGEPAAVGRTAVTGMAARVPAGA